MGFDRRTFIKFAAGASAGIMVTPLPWKLLDDVAIWTQNWSWIPSPRKGETTYTNAFSKLDPFGVPMKVRRVRNMPVRVLPQPGHPLGGGLSALSIAETQLLYSPSRLQRPQLRGADGKFKEVSWPEASRKFQEELRNAGQNIAFISGDENSSVTEVLSALANALGSNDIYLMPSEAQSAAKAAELMGFNARFGYDLEGSDHVLAIGANILENWGTVLRNRRIFKNSHPHSFRNKETNKEDTANTAALVYAGPLQNNTAAVAESWLPIYPGTEGVLALGIANLLIAAGKTAPAADFDAFKDFVAAYGPEKTAELTGVDRKKLEAEVAKLLAAEKPLLIIGAASGSGAGAAALIAGMAVNALLGNINRPGGITLLPKAGKILKNAAPLADIYRNDLTQFFARREKPALLLIHEANPIYALPNPEACKAALKAVPFKVSFSTFMDETSALCDLVLPLSMGLERVDDAETPYGSGKISYCISAMVAKPGAGVLNTGNVILSVARRLGKDLGFELYEDLLRAKARLYEKSSFESLAAGFPAESDEKVEAGAFSFKPGILDKAFALEGNKGKVRLAAYVRASLGTAKTGIPPYSNKTLRADELRGNLMSVLINGATAARNKLADGDKVFLEGGGKKIAARVRVFEGIINDAAGVCLGFGHSALDEFSQNKGANVMELVTAAPEPETGLNFWCKAGVDIYKA
ncbi:MAG: molybdopterin-dependent oxidoreductase [Desulfovibrio sp.]|jgi:anaerobic selenocysteine-containing dehydrogenase|nr:molybdopterin-dependent oxidoreductase [Desulfovibrio sp.]